MGTAPMGDDHAMQLKAQVRSSAVARGTHASGAPSRDPSRARRETSLAVYAARLPDRQAPLRMMTQRPVAAKAVGSFVPRLTRPAFERYGFSAAALITDWETIVGADLARFTMPERLKWPKRVQWTGTEVSDEERGRPGATLMLAVAAERALDIQYKAAQLIERINSYFGYRAVAELRIVQVASIGPPEAVALPPVAPMAVAPSPKPREELAQITAPGLRAALERMAEGLVTRTERRRAGA
jgi:hypothetical protein